MPFSKKEHEKFSPHESSGAPKENSIFLLMCLTDGENNVRHHRHFSSFQHLRAQLKISDAQFIRRQIKRPNMQHWFLFLLLVLYGGWQNNYKVLYRLLLDWRVESKSAEQRNRSFLKDYCFFSPFFRRRCFRFNLSVHL